MRLLGSQPHTKFPLFPLLASPISFIQDDVTNSWSSCQEFGCTFSFVNISVSAFVLKILLCNNTACERHSQPATGQLSLWRVKGRMFSAVRSHALVAAVAAAAIQPSPLSAAAGSVKTNVRAIFKQTCLWTFKTCMLYSCNSTFVLFITNHRKIENLIFCHNYTTGDKLFKNIVESFEDVVLILLTSFPTSSLIQPHQPLPYPPNYVTPATFPLF